ncbi:MAG TPA: c-type cytochrome, partial [Anseongella sp.]|nr:c-type cytochrome [Anseongella sp.]
ERFRPVSLYNGPDGALYVVDMYRGIIQHKDFLTSYLKEEILERKLYRPLSYGRIYKIIPEDSRPQPLRMPEDPLQLTGLLGHPDGWVRAQAQQKLVDSKASRAVPALRDLLRPGNKPLAAVHALWTLEGLGALEPGDVLPLLEGPDRTIRMQALSALPALINKENYRSYLPLLEDVLQEKDSLGAPYAAFLSRHIGYFDKAAARNLLWQAASAFPDNEYVAAAVISNLENREASFLKELVSLYPDSSLALAKGLRKVIADAAQIEANKKNNETMKKTFPKGYALYTSLCQPCHGEGGNGVKSLAPPLNGSEWVTGSPDRLAAVVLYGLTGPIKVNGALYTVQEVSGDMPGIGGNKELKDAEIAELLSFIRHSWSNRAGKIAGEDIAEVRKRFKDRQKAFTAEELEGL